MAIVKRGSRYQAKVRGPDGRWWTATASTRKDAQTIEREMRQARDLGLTWVHPRDRQARLTVRRLAERYIAAHPAPLLAHSTRMNRAGHLERFVAWGEASRRRGFYADQLTRSVLEAWLSQLLEDGLSPDSVRTMARSVSAAWAWGHEYDEEQAWEGLVPRPRRPTLPRAPRKLTIAPTFDEIDLMLEHVAPPWAARLAVLQRFLALRVRAAAALRWDDIDFGRGEVHVRAEITKGGYGARLLPLHPQLGYYLRKWRGKGPFVVADWRPQPVSYVFRVFNRAWQDSGVREAVWRGRPSHAFRKAMKTHLRAKGADPDAVDIFLGHSLKTTTQVYVDPSAWPLGDLVKLIPDIEGRGPEVME